MTARDMTARDMTARDMTARDMTVPGAPAPAVPLGRRPLRSRQPRQGRCCPRHRTDSERAVTRTELTRPRRGWASMERTARGGGCGCPRGCRPAVLLGHHRRRRRRDGIPVLVGGGLVSTVTTDTENLPTID